MKKVLSILFGVVFTTSVLFAGNPDRAGSAGASQLRINPWAKSSGLANANVASITGAEAIFLNVAGLAFTQKTEVMFNTTNYLKGSDINIAALGFSQKMGESGVFGLNVISMNFGEIERTSGFSPDGGAGTYSPSFTNLGISFAKSFSNSIYGGITLRMHTESMAELKASGLAFDAGVRYVTGEEQNAKFAITLKNVGPPYQYEGDGLDDEFKDQVHNIPSTQTRRAEQYELPAQLNIAFSYDFNFSEDHKFTASTAFTSNSFGSDVIQFGGEYTAYKWATLRGGYMVARKASESASSVITDVLSGPAFGFSLNPQLGSTRVSIDYGYRATELFDGIHTIGARINVQ